MRMSRKGIVLLSSNSAVNLSICVTVIEVMSGECRNWVSVFLLSRCKYRQRIVLTYKDRTNRSQMTQVVYKASCWDCQDFYIGTEQNVDCVTEKLNTCHASCRLQTGTQPTGRNLKWNQFDILAEKFGQISTHCKIKETLPIRELKPTLNYNFSGEKLNLY